MISEWGVFPLQEKFFNLIIFLLPINNNMTFDHYLSATAACKRTFFQEEGNAAQDIWLSGEKNA